MNQLNILVLFGGVSPEHDISVQSAASVISALGNHNVIPVHITRSGKWLLYDGKLDNVKAIDWEKYGTPAVLSPDRETRGLLRIVGEKVKILPVDLVFPVLHGPNGEDGTIQGLCELAGIPYVGSGVTASSASMDKSVTKLIAKALKIPQGDYLTYDADEIAANIKAVMRKISSKIGYPCFVKPAIGGSSIGISKVESKEALEEALLLAMSLCDRILIEKAVVGREIEVGILGNGMNAEASVPGEVIADGAFYDYEAKYEKPKSQTLVPADLSDDVVATIQKNALAIYRALGCVGLSRVDFFVTEDGKMLLNEINTIPGFTQISMYAKMWEASGLPWFKLIQKLVQLGYEQA